MCGSAREGQAPGSRGQPGTGLHSGRCQNKAGCSPWDSLTMSPARMSHMGSAILTTCVEYALHLELHVQVSCANRTQRGKT